MKFTDRKYGELKFTDRIKVEELEFTDRKQENWGLQIESMRTGVYKRESKRTQFTDIKQGNSGDRKQENWSLQIKSSRTEVYKQKVGQN